MADPPRIVISHDEDLKYRILYEAHDTAMDGHFGREKAYDMVCQTYWSPNRISGSACMCARVKRTNKLSPRLIRQRLWQVRLFPLDVKYPLVWTLCLAYRKMCMSTQVLWSLLTG